MSFVHPDTERRTRPAPIPLRSYDVTDSHGNAFAIKAHSVEAGTDGRLAFYRHEADASLTTVVAMFDADCWLSFRLLD
jgi:hypothetical protein